MKAEQLRSRLRQYGQVGVAFSGGVDSSFLLRSAADALGAENVLALHARSCLQKQEEQERALSWPERQGCALRLRVVELEPLTWPEFVRNPPERCYCCKRRLYQLFQDLLIKEGVPVLLDGTNADDLQQGEGGRPGLRAVAELGVQTPLAACGLRKAEIRELSRGLRLDTWNLPSASCLATRIPHGMAVTAGRLEFVATMEQSLAASGFPGCRARLLDDTAVCLQLRSEHLDLFSVRQVREEVRRSLKSMGVNKMLLDLDGR